MQATDTTPWGYAAVDGEGDWNAMRARAELSVDEPEPDWDALRARAEAETAAQGVEGQDEPEPDWDALRAQAEREQAFEAASRMYEAQAPHHHAHAPVAGVFASPSIAPAPHVSFDPPAPTWDDAEVTPKGTHPWKSKLMLAAAVVVLGVGATALVRHQAAEAEREARTMALLQEMREADEKRAADEARLEAERRAAASVAEAQRPGAEAPSGTSTVAAMLANSVKQSGSAQVAATTQVRPQGKVRPLWQKKKVARRGRAKREGKTPQIGDGLVSRSKDPLYGL
jgi:hypothetical protein